MKKIKYFKLCITSLTPSTEIWVGDTDGCLVQKEVGKIKTRLLPGDYTVEFGLGTPTYPIHLDNDYDTTQEEIMKGKTCTRPVFKL